MPRRTRSRTNFAFVVDSSSSIRDYGLTAAVINAFNTRTEAVRREAARAGHDVSITLVTFNTTPQLVYFNAGLDNLRPLTFGTFYPSGSTAMLDGLGMAIENLQTIQHGPNDAFLVETITDGEENASTKYGIPNTGRWHFSKRDVGALMRTLTAQGNWTFAFQVPQRFGDRLASSFRIPRESIMEWEQTEAGVERGTECTTSALGNYMTARSKGQCQVAAFYATTDLSQVKPKEVQRKLDDISHRFRIWEVPSEARIDDFVTKKTRKPYVVGQAYYQLMKTETVQPQKDVLIMEKGKTAVWGGQQARDLVGLPAGTNAKVTPGNHANYDVYIQSTSVNRKLPRGTKVLVDVVRVKGEKPTWGN